MSPDRPLIARSRRALLLPLACAAMALAARPARALDPRLAVTQYRQDVWQEGLPQFSIHAIAQTPDGYLWLATQAGLARFNGARFTVFDTRNTPELRSNVVWGLCARPRGQPLDRDGQRRAHPVPGRHVHELLDPRRPRERSRLLARRGSRGRPLDRHRRGALALARGPLQRRARPGPQAGEGAARGRRGAAVDRHRRRRPLLPAGRRAHALHHEGRARQRPGARGARRSQGPRVDRQRRARPRRDGGALHHPHHRPGTASRAT